MNTASAEDRSPYTLGRNVLVYVRSSTDEQSRSCGQQLKEIGGFLKERFKVATRSLLSATAEGIYVDDGYSGWKLAPDERPNCQSMLEYCKRNPRPDGDGRIVIWALSRLGRFRDGPAEAIYWIHHLRRFGWIVVSVTQPGFDESGENRLLRVITAALEAEKDTSSSEEKSRGVARGKLDQMERGVWTGGVAPYGYDRWAARLSPEGDAIEWIELLPQGKRNGNQDSVTLLRPSESAETVRWIFATYLEGEKGSELSLEAIARHLNDREISTHKEGACWYHTTISKVLSNEAYIAIQRDSEGMPHEALWKPIIPLSTWEKVKRKLGSNRTRRRGTNSPHYLSGIVFCSECGLRYHGDTHDNIRYYKTRKRPHGEDCEACRRRVRADLLEPRVIQAVEELSVHPKVVAAIEAEKRLTLESKSDRGQKIGKLNEQIQDIRDQISRLTDLVSIGGAAGETVREKLETLNAEIADLKRRRESILSSGKDKPSVETFVERSAHLRELLEVSSAAERKSIVCSFVSTIEVNRLTQTIRIGIRKVA